MLNCDICNQSVSGGEGAVYSADEFRTLVRRGYEPPATVKSMMTAMGLTMEQWKNGLVAESATPWMLCPTCAVRARSIMRPGSSNLFGDAHTTNLIMTTMAQVQRLSSTAKPSKPAKKQVRCFHCRQTKDEGQDPCPHCGFFEWGMVAGGLLVTTGCLCAMVFWFESMGWLIAMGILGGIFAIAAIVFASTNIYVIRRDRHRDRRSTVGSRATTPDSPQPDDNQSKAETDEDEDEHIDGDVDADAEEAATAASATPTHSSASPGLSKTSSVSPPTARWTTSVRKIARVDCHSKSVDGTAKLAVSPDGKYLAGGGGSQGGDVCLFDLVSAQKTATLEAHPYYGVTDLIFSPDSSRLVSTGNSNDGKVRIWNAADGTLIHDLKGNSYDNRTLSISPDGIFLASAGGGDNAIRLWNLKDGTEFKVLKGHASKVSRVRFTGDGRYLVSGDDQSVVRIWSIPDGEMLVRCRADDGNGVTSLELSPDGRYAVTGTHTHIRVWSIPDGAEVAHVERTFWIYSLGVSPDGKLFSACGSYGAPGLWDLPSASRKRELTGHKGEVTCMTFSPDGRFMATGSKDQDVILWRLPDGGKLAVLEDHPGHVSSIAISPDGSTVIVGSKDGSITFWNCTAQGSDIPVPVSMPTTVGAIQPAPRPKTLTSTAIATSPADAPQVDLHAELDILNGAYLARHDEELEAKVNSALDRIAGNGDAGIRTLVDRVFKDMTLDGTQLMVHFTGDSAWNEWLKKQAAVRALARAKAVSVVPKLTALASANTTAAQFYEILKPALNQALLELSAVSPVAAAKDPVPVICAGCQAKIRVRSGKPTGTIKCPRCGQEIAITATPSLSPEQSATQSAAPGTAASPAKAVTPKAATPAKWRRKKVVNGHDRPVTPVRISPDGRYLAASSGVWNLPSLEPMQLEGLRTGDAVQDLAFTPDSELMITSSDGYGGKVRVWNLAESTLLHELAGTGSGNSTLSVSPNGSLLASAGGGNNAIRLWNLKDGTEFKVLKGHASKVSRVRFTADGRYLVSGDDQSVVRIWSIPDGEMLVRCRADEGNGVKSLELSPDGRYAVTGTHTHIRVWSIPDGAEVAHVERTFWIYSLGVSPDGKLFSACGSSGDPGLWDLPSGSRKRDLTGHKGEVTCMMFSPDGRFMATGGKDQDVILWRLPDGGKLAVLEDHPGHVSNIAVSPDGELVAVGSRDGTLTIWVPS